jgi:Dyp-type peroxidase family
MSNDQAALDLTDIQGNILRGYSRQPYARFMPFRVLSADAGRKFLRQLLPLITPGEWGAGGRPDMTTNVAISFPGLCALEPPYECLVTFPVEFQEGMRARARMLGDTEDSAPERWDPPWDAERVHFVVMVYAIEKQGRQTRCHQISRIVETINADAGTTVIAALRPQDAQRLKIDGKLTRKEHFGFVDGISNPDVEGVPDNGAGDDIGNPNEQGVFRKIPAGEFILGYPGEGGEVAPMPLPRLLGRNGSYLVIRKLEQKVKAFRDFVDQQSTFLQQVPADVAPKDFLAAKMMGRWQDGSPLILYPDGPRKQPEKHPENRFGYSNDLTGAACPLGAHIRRANPRDSLGFGGKVMSRHRLIRRGIPYGTYLPEGDEPRGGQPQPPVPAPAPDQPGDGRGIMFLAYNSGFDQFEFVQETWINFGDDFHQGNDMDPITGSAGNRRMMIPGDERTGRRAFLCWDIPRFVTTKGGDYFFVPGLTGLRLLAFNQVRVS